MRIQFFFVILHSEMEQTFKDIRDLLAQRILILDGAMGTKIQQFGLSAEHFHGKRFASHPVSLAGNNDILCLTAPEVVKDIHRLYIEAGADIIMLDNMSVEDMKKAVALCAGKAETECSGNVTKENVAKLVDIGVDYISSGALTHSSPILDLSLKNLHSV